MPRELRSRKSRPNYAAMYRFDEEEEEAGPSGSIAATLDDLIDSGSDFAPDGGAAGTEDDEDNLTEVEDEEQEVGEDKLDEDDAEDLLQPNRARRPKGEIDGHTKGKGKSTESSFIVEPRRKSSARLGGGLSRPQNRQMYTLPMPSVNHRYRAIPIHTHRGLVERLAQPPALFGLGESRICPTKSYTSQQTITERMNKTWGANIGSGPLWELMEDRTWFKESIRGEGEEREGKRRPRVYADIKVLEGWEVCDAEQASLYIPSDTVTTEEGILKSPPPLTCFFGPFGQQVKREIKIFETIKLSELSPLNHAHVFNAGAPVWGLDWCPIHSVDRPRRLYKQYLAVAPFPSRSHNPYIGKKVQRPSRACLQIWTLSPCNSRFARSPSGTQGMPQAKGKDKERSEGDGEMQCEMVLLVDGGPALEVKWCPLPSHDELVDTVRQSETPRKLGLLAGVFEDGSASIYVVPEPMDVSHPSASGPVFVKTPEPLVRIEHEDSACLTLEWANSEVVAVGCANGSIVVYDVGQAIRDGQRRDILPRQYVSVHQSAVRGLSWIQAPPSTSSGIADYTEDPTVIASGGYDGVECLTDTRDPCGNVFNRTRDVVTCMSYSAYAGGPITIDHENIIKVYQVSPSMLGRGHHLLEPGGPVWDVNASDYHPQLAVGSADGACTTTNMLKNMRRGGAVPFLSHKIYQMDYSRISGEYRMLDQFLPQETQDRPSATRARKLGKSIDIVPVGTGAWSPEVGIHRVAWNNGNGLSSAPILASATASGLCRIDWLTGRWFKGRIPYGSVENVRLEVDGAGIDDEEDEEDE